MIASRHVLRFVTIFQYLLRLYSIYPLSSEIVKVNGVMMEKAWAGAAYNLTLYMLASHVLGSSWYLLSIERQDECWKKACTLQFPYYRYHYLDCHSIGDPDRYAGSDQAISQVYVIRTMISFSFAFLLML
ncbi:hypothetical protein TanjilG_00022 [Lupinus angustifolius]|uniref:Uncharacterized protein n=1 Tax=Lupinus angustifolius TaxID=3871 RepID=A0A4P1QSW6_LUPAN|nr:hypothetical protein TanjilG_00022 [Lupinus angustifolius]